MVKKTGYLLVILFFLVISLMAFYFDAEIIRGVSLIRNVVLNEFFLGITFVSSEIIMFFFLTSLFLWSENKRKWILPLWVSLLLTVIVSFLLKVWIQRLRPFQQGIVSTLPTLNSTNFLTWNFSFPSFQAMLVFAAIPILNKEFPRFRYFWIVFASLVAFSRLYFGLHFLSDVLIGGLIGYGIGFIIVKTETKTKLFENIYKKIF